LQPRRLIAEHGADRTGESQAKGRDQSRLASAEVGQFQPPLNRAGPMKPAMILAIAPIEIALDVQLPLRS